MNRIIKAFVTFKKENKTRLHTAKHMIKHIDKLDSKHDKTQRQVGQLHPPPPFPTPFPHPPLPLLQGISTYCVKKKKKFSKLYFLNFVTHSHHLYGGGGGGGGGGFSSSFTFGVLNNMRAFHDDVCRWFILLKLWNKGECFFVLHLYMKCATSYCLDGR